MTTELTKAAQQALKALAELLPDKKDPNHGGHDARDVRKWHALVERLRALTQRPAAQTEREAFERAALAKWGPLDFERSEAVPEMYYNQRLDDAWIGFGFAVAWLRASLPAPQQATPERHLTVTTNQQGEAVMVSWQDDEHRILEVVWERKQATPEPRLFIGACITDGRLHATVQRLESNGNVTLVATAEMDAASLHGRDCMAQMTPATPEPDDDGPEFTVSDPDLNHLLNLAADMAKGRCNHDTGMAWLQALETVEARLTATPEPDRDGEAFRTAARLGLTLRFYGGCAQSGMPGSPSAYEVVSVGGDPAAAMREAVERASAVIRAGGEAQKIATPEPVGEPVAQVSDLFPSVRNKLHAQGFDSDAPLFTRPAPGVPEGFVLVPVEPTEEMTTAVEHAMWDKPSVKGADVWSAVIAAAQAKGGV